MTLNVFAYSRKNIKPEKLHCTIFHLKNYCGYFYWRMFSPCSVSKWLNLKDLITRSPHYDILAKTCSRLTAVSGYLVFPPKWRWFTRAHYLLLVILVIRIQSSLILTLTTWRYEMTSTIHLGIFYVVLCPNPACTAVDTAELSPRKCCVIIRPDWSRPWPVIIVISPHIPPQGSWCHTFP